MFYYLIITLGGGLSENLAGIEHNALDGVGLELFRDPIIHTCRTGG